jgi:hypothetical protein
MDKIRKYVEQLFERVPQTIKNKEIKEELITNLEEKYSDLIKTGMNEKKAYEEVIKSIGNLDEIIENEPILKEKQKKKAFFISISVMLYILSIAFIPFSEGLNLNENIQVTGFLIIVAFATGLIVYYNISYGEKIAPKKEMYALGNKAVRFKVNSILWLLIVTVYLLLSFLTGAWYITWIIFIIGALIETIISLIFSLGGK